MKSTVATWTQDGTGLLYQKNPRPTSTIVTDDAGNTRKTTISYFTYTDPATGDSFTLPENVNEYGNASTIKRRTHTEYKWDSAYTSRRVIGLPSTKIIYEGTATPASKVTYEYDEAAPFFVNQGAATSHDAAGYPATLRVGRGNLTSVRRWDVDYPDDATKDVETNVGYNNHGSVILTRNALGRQATIEYTDSFSDPAKNGNTLAYPTKVTPPLATGEAAANFASTTQYNYDFGAVTETKGPVPAGNTSGAAQATEYDAAGRVSKVKNLVNNAYTTWTYDPSGIVSTHVLTQPGVLAFSTTVSDGAGRPIVTASDNSGTAGDYNGRAFYYDVMGRLSRQSNPAKVNSAWEPSGEDGAAWTLTVQDYDWKGRPTLTTNPDGTTRSVTYGGCGCAGGEVATVIDGVGRMQRVTSDTLGRPWKAEVMNWENSLGNRTVYSTTKNVYNVLDQVTQVIEQVGTSGTSQSTTIEYDGHGRVWKKKAPEATAPTVFEFFSDGSIKKMTDARNASTNYTYSVRGQITGISYTAPSGVAATASVAFDYDPAGNRLWMTDEFGRVDYAYDALSRLESETRQFNGVSNPTTGSGGKYALTYQYTLSGSVKSITDPFGDRIDYAYDKVERLTGLSGTAFAGVTQYASQIKYRAWGAVKELTYGDGLKATLTYNERLAPAQYELKDASNVIQMGAAYQYYGDGRLKFVDDLREPRFDRQFKYDHAGRVTEAESGYMARDEAYPGNNTLNGPYYHYYGYDQFGHLTSRTGAYWYKVGGETYTASYTDNKNQNAGWLYDADGRLTQSQTTGSAPSYPYTQTYTQTYTYDAAGRRTDGGKYDGQGQHTKSTNGMLYYVRSSVLSGMSISEVHSELQPTVALRGTKSSSFVYLGGVALAQQVVINSSSSSSENIKWTRKDPSNTSVHLHDDWNLPVSTGGKVQLAQDLQGIAVEAPDYAKLQQTPSWYSQTYNSYNYGGYGYAQGFGTPGYSSSDLGATGGSPGNFGTGCTLDGIPAPCDAVAQLVNRGAATVDMRNPGNGLENLIRQGILLPIFVTGTIEFPNTDYRPVSVPVLTGWRFNQSYSHSNQEQVKWTEVSRSGIADMMREVIAFLDANPECEKKTNQLLEELKNSTGFDAGSIRDIISKFSQTGRLLLSNIEKGTGTGQADFDSSGRPFIEFTRSTSTAHTANTFIHEVIHWAGLQAVYGPKSPYRSLPIKYYSDEPVAKAWHKLGIGISRDQFMEEYKGYISAYEAKTGEKWPDRWTYSYIAGADQRIACGLQEP